ncbi:MAG TPA: Ig-like domain-containing protein, partial [Gemmatimonadales bacterium]|nr:Ig-like domain-containing protein [Gemmatimonadales bacterium]
MSKLYRSLLWSGLIVAGVTACGDDVTVAPPPNAGVRSVTVGPTGATIAVGATQQMVATVDADAGIATTVTWSSSNPATATVNPTTGLVTGVAGGTVSIIACSTVATNVCGQATLTVSTAAPATISIKAITAGGTLFPVNIANVAGQIDVILNLDAGTQVVSNVQVLVDNVVACEQSFSAVQAAIAKAQAALVASEDPTAALVVEIVCSFNTAEFNATTGVPKFFNGQRLITARVNLVGSAPVATPSKTLTFNNASGFVLSVSSSNAPDPNSATDPRTGLLWLGGSVTFNVIGVSYVQGVTLA